MLRRRRFIQGAGALLAPAAALGQPAPLIGGEVQIVMPADPGGNMSSLGRVLVAGLATLQAQPVVIAYRPGGDGTIATLAVARSAPNGRTLLLSGSHTLVYPLLRADAGYDALVDLEPVARMASAPSVLIVHESLRGLSLEQLSRRTAAGGGAIAYASTGLASSANISAQLVMLQTGARWLHVPYRGSGQAVRAVVSGEVQLMFVPAAAVATALSTGRVIALAVAQEHRIASLPGIPTLAELGVRGADSPQWYGVFAPARTPAAVLSHWSDLMLRVLLGAETRRHMESIGFEHTPLGRAEFGAFLGLEQQRLATLIRSAGIKPE